MNRYPFEKLLTYLVVISKFDGLKFAENRELYLPAIIFNNEDPFVYLCNELEKKTIPVTVKNGTCDKPTLKLYLKQLGLTTLHLSFETEPFLDLVFDFDLRTKVDGMALSPVFRRIDILNEFINVPPGTLDLYLDCFSNYKSVYNIPSFIKNYIGDTQIQSLFTRLISTTSRQFSKVLLDIKVAENAPKQNIERASNIINYKLQDALVNDDNVAIEKWIKLSAMISEKLHKLGAGNRSDIHELLDLLTQDKDFEEPHIYTIEELEAMKSEAT